MPYFAEETVQAVRDIPLYDIVRMRVELSRVGHNWRGLSPFSNERTPSFFVISDKNFFKCHSTGLAGDGIKFIQETEKLSFSEAVEALAERFNIEIRYASGGGPDPAMRSRRQTLLDIYAQSCAFFHRQLLAERPDSASVRDYWTAQRGFTMEHAEQFQIGLAPVDAAPLLQFLLKKGFAADLLAESGLFHAARNPRDPSSWFPVFSGRLMIPIHDIQGQVVAFTARQLDITPREHASWKAKYINSPETPIFKKGDMLFHMDVAREATREAGRALLVEGQLDALRCHAVGLTEAVAPQGTSITDSQLQLLKRYTDHLDVLLDSDAAGVRAILRLIPMALRARLEVHVFALPQGSDPDDFLRAHGKAGLETLAREPAIRYMATAMLPQDPSPEARARVLDDILRAVAACPNAVARDGYLAQAAAATGVSEFLARNEFKHLESSPVTTDARAIAIPEKIPVRWLTNAEGDLIWAVLQNVRWAHSLAYVVDQQWIRKRTAEGRLLDHILNLAISDQLESIDDIYNTIEEDDLRDCFAQYRVEERSVDSLESAVNNSVVFLYKTFCREQTKMLNQQLHEQSSHGNVSQAQALMEQIREFNRRRLSGPYPTVIAPDVLHA